MDTRVTVPVGQAVRTHAHRCVLHTQLSVSLTPALCSIHTHRTHPLNTQFTHDPRTWFTRATHTYVTHRGHFPTIPAPLAPISTPSLAWGPHGTVCSAALREIQAAWKRRCFPGTFPPPSLTACSTHTGTCARTRTCSSCSRHTQAHVRTHTHTYIVLDTHTQAHVYRHAHTHILL